MVKIAVATVGNKGLEDIVSQEFGHSRTFTLIDIEDGKVVKVDVIENPARNIAHGRGPIIAKSLADKNVETIISGEVGPGASTILKQLDVKILIVKPGRKVIDVLRENKLIV